MKLEEIAGHLFAFESDRVYEVREGHLDQLTIHPRTGKVVRESTIRFPEDYPAREVAHVLRESYGRDARRKAAEWGWWEAELLLAEVRG